MENNITVSEKEAFDEMADDFIKLTFKGWKYTTTISFVETLLEKLKASQKQSNSPIIKDILGR